LQESCWRNRRHAPHQASGRPAAAALGCGSRAPPNFPDWFEFVGGETSCFNQVGNAVPPLFAYQLAGAVREYLGSSKRLSSAEIVYRNLPDQLSLDLGLILHETPEMKIPNFIGTSEKSKSVVKVINQAVHILQKLGIPLEGLTPRNLEKMGMAFLAVADVKSERDWEKAKGYDGNRALKSREVITYLNKHFGEKISSGSYDDIRRKDLKLPVAAGIITKSAGDLMPPGTIQPAHTRLTPIMLGSFVVSASRDGKRTGGVSGRTRNVGGETGCGAGIETGSRDPAQRSAFSPGEHNQLQKSIIEKFLPRFGNGADVLYVGDTADKFLCIEKAKLKALNFFELAHGELPDVVAYSKRRIGCT